MAGTAAEYAIGREQAKAILARPRCNGGCPCETCVDRALDKLVEVSGRDWLRTRRPDLFKETQWKN